MSLYYCTEENSTIKNVAESIFPGIKGKIINVLANEAYFNLLKRNSQQTKYLPGDMALRIGAAGVLVSLKSKELAEKKIINRDKSGEYSMQLDMLEALLIIGHEISPERQDITSIINSICEVRKELT